MAQWLKSRDKAVCPISGEAIESAGSKYSCRVSPCIRNGKTCEHLGQSHASCYYASAQCKFKGVQ